MSSDHEARERRYVARMPADVERPDRVLLGLTGRQSAILAAVAVVLWLGFTATRRVIPPMVFLGAAAPLIILAIALALGQRDGISLDRFLLAALRHRVRPRRMVNAPDGVDAPPTWIDPQLAQQAPAAAAGARSPVVTVTEEGVIELGGDGAVMLLAVSTVNLALRSSGEQQALIGAFAGWLHSLSGPTQILVRSHRIDLAPAIAKLVEAAPGLPHPALEQAAHDHAAYLNDLASSHDLLARQVLIALREPSAHAGGDARARVRQRAADAAAALAGTDLRAVVLDGQQATAVLAGAAVPEAVVPDRLAPPGHVITGPPVWGWS